MRKAFIISLILLTQNIFSQSIDSTAIGFKAKLFTVSEYGSSNRETILEDIEKQEIKFLETKYENFIFMKISFSQPYRKNEEEYIVLYRNCEYYLAFNKINYKFYKLGGFDFIDIDSFFKDLITFEGNIFRDVIEYNEIEEIRIHCLYEYYKMSPKRRFKKGYSCLTNCSSITETTIIIH